MSFTRRFHPWLAQVRPDSRDRFEGWYFKMTTAEGKSCALIPGLSTSRNDPHSFIQYIDGHSGQTAYLRYGAADFSTTDNPFEIRVGTNVFSPGKIRVDANGNGTDISAELRLGPWNPYPSGFFRPGIMGPFGVAGFLECYHGIVSAGHSVEGTLGISTTDGAKEWEFRDGKGYAEKDWGHSFPADYLWLQANSFPDPEISVFASLAAIPFLGRDFPGHIAFTFLPERGFLTFATWNGSRVEKIEMTHDSYLVQLSRGKYALEIKARQTAAGRLRAPISGSMARVIKESVDGELEFELRERGKIIAQGLSAGAGLEQGGNPASLSAWFLTGRRT